MFTPVSTRSASAYKRVGVQTSIDGASPHQLICLLFDALLLSLAKARAAIARGDVELKGKEIGRAIRILEEGLKCGLNLEQGGELAQNLDRLYGYCVVRLTQANARNDVAALEEVLRLVEPLADGWRQIGTAGASQLMAA